MFQDPRSPGGGGVFGDPWNLMPGQGGLMGGGISPTQMGLLQGFAALAQAGAPSTTPKSFGGALSQGLMGGLQGYGQGMQLEAMKDQGLLRKAQMGELQRKTDQQKQRDAYITQLEQTLPEDQRALLRANPDLYLQAHFKQKLDNPFGNINPKDYTPESIAKFNTTKNFADLVAAKDPSKAPAETELTKLIRERDQLFGVNPNDPNVGLYDKKIKKLTEQTPPISIQNLPADRRFEWEDKLRADYGNDIKAFREVEDAHRIITHALQNPSAANDLAAATKFMKLLDPTSVVRESELGMAMQASGVLDRATNYANVLKTGQKLTPAQREDFARSAEIIYQNVQGKWREIDGIYDETANAYGLDPRRVKMGRGSKPAQQQKIPRYNPATGKIE